VVVVVVLLAIMAAIVLHLRELRFLTLNFHHHHHCSCSRQNSCTIICGVRSFVNVLEGVLVIGVGLHRRKEK
jgi:hypothetical protein